MELLTTIYHTVTLRCPYKCPQCYLRTLVCKEERDTQKKDFSIASKRHLYSILTGGEPLLLGTDYLVELISENPGRTAIISTGWKLSADQVKRFLRAGLDAWICSIDFAPGYDDRSDWGWKSLELFTKERPDFDLSAIVTLAKWSLPHLKGILERLMELDVRADMVFLEEKKDGYIFAGDVSHDRLSEDDVSYVREVILNYLGSGLRIIGKKVWCNDELLGLMYTGLADCGDTPVILTLFPNGHLTLCYRVFGKRVCNYTLESALDNWKQFLQDWRKDKEELCKGCSWWCGVFPNYVDPVDPEEHWEEFHRAGKRRQQGYDRDLCEDK